MTNSITLHENMGNSPAWSNPNVWPGDSNGNPITPQHGQEAHLWARVKNDGTAEATNVVVSFYLCNPSGGLVWPAAAHGSNSVPSLAAGGEVNIMCSVPWIPNSTTGAHKCIVAVASCLDCPAPSTEPGTAIDPNNKQIGQHNITIHQLSKSANIVKRSFHIQAPAKGGHVELQRDALANNSDLLRAKGINPNIQEAPSDEVHNIVNTRTGEKYGNKLQFNAGDNHDLEANIQVNTPKEGTAALYHVRHYEDGKLVGGVSHLILH